MNWFKKKECSVICIMEDLNRLFCYVILLLFIKGIELKFIPGK